MLGAPWLSRALGDVRLGRRPTPVRGSSSSIRGGSGPIPPGWRPSSISARPIDWLDGAPSRRRVAVRSGSGSTRGGRARSKAQAAIAEVLGTDLSEPLVARAVHRYAAETGATLVVAASMPIRDLEWYADSRPRCRRGCWPTEVRTGSTASCRPRWGWPRRGQRDRARRTVALLGDLAFLHDVSGLVNLPEVPCTFVVLDNGGGGIFSFLPQATSVEPAVFEQLFGTPPDQ